MKQTGRHRTRRFATTFAAAACVLLMGTGVIFAAAHWLTPSQVAHEIGDSKLEAAFQSEDAVMIGETQSFDKYDVTLLGMVSGKDLSKQKVEAAYNEEADNAGFDEDKTYVVTAIERTDGGQIGDEESFFISPLVDGYGKQQVNIAMLRGGYSSVYADDMKTEYSIVDMENIEPFADHKIHLAVQDGGFFDDAVSGTIAYDYDEETGVYTPNQDYSGVNALFDLPVDEAKADPAKAKEILEQPYETPGESLETDDVDRWAENLTPETIGNLAVPVKGTKQTVRPRANGAIEVSYKLANGAGGEMTETMDSLFPDGKPGMSNSFSYSKSDDAVYVDVYILNDDGTVTYELYQKK